MRYYISPSSVSEMNVSVTALFVELVAKYKNPDDDVLGNLELLLDYDKVVFKNPSKKVHLFTRARYTYTVPLCNVSLIADSGKDYVAVCRIFKTGSIWFAEINVLKENFIESMFRKLFINKVLKDI